jgi:hypothetical protein
MVMGLGVVLASPAAQATDRKVYGGASCHSLGSSYLSQFIGQDGSWQNLAGVPISVICPIVRDEHSAATDMTAEVFVSDTASGVGTDFQVRCRFHSVSSTGGTIDTVLQSTSDTGTGNFTLSYTGITPSAAAGSSVFLRCIVPNNSKIFSYQVTESEQTD